MGTLLGIVFFALVGGLGYLYVAGLRQIPTDRIAIVTRRFGRHHPHDRYNVRLHGSPGPQATVLQSNTRHWLPRFMFDVTLASRTFVPPGTIGLVMAKEGEHLPPGRALARHVECDFFQDGTAFLRSGGEQGPQLAVLPGGGYYSINPMLFDVITVHNVDDARLGLNRDDLMHVSLLEGHVGVVVVTEGSPLPDEEALGRHVPGHNGFQLPWVFFQQGGQRGTQAEILPSGGRYAVNPWFARVVRVPSRDLILQWADKPDIGDRYDSALKPIPLTIEGYKMQVHLTQTLRIPPQAAPALVRRFGEQETAEADQWGIVDRPVPVKRFVERVLGELVKGYFNSVSTEYRITDFVNSQNRVLLDLEHRVEQALSREGVVAIKTTLSQIDFENDEVNRLFREQAATRQKYQRLQQDLRNAEIAKDIKMIELEVDRAREELKTVEAQIMIRLLGADQIKRERYLERLVKMGVPRVIAAGNDASALAQFVTPAAIIDAANRAMNDTPDALEEGSVAQLPSAHSDGTKDDDDEGPTGLVGVR